MIKKKGEQSDELREKQKIIIITINKYKNVHFGLVFYLLFPLTKK